MTDTDILILGGPEIDGLLEGREQAILDAVAAAYLAHGQGDSSLPHSLFLRFPNDPKNRIIALPAFLGGEAKLAGVKWIASFPDNVERGIDRATATIILNSMETGRPEAILEGSLISAKRTAASAALAARALHPEVPAVAGLVGCGVINLEIARFLLAVFPDLQQFTLFDLQRARAEQFAERCRALAPARDLQFEIADSVPGLLARCRLVSLATTAGTPHLADLTPCDSESTILHVSLRDLTPELILGCDNIVDDVDHVTRAQTSIHLAEQQVGHRTFIRATLADVLAGAAPPRTPGRVVVFSPFGLGVLDLAVSKLVYDEACRLGRGTRVSNFFPDVWTRS